MLVLGLFITAAAVLFPPFWAKLTAWSAAQGAALQQGGLWTLAQITSLTDTNHQYNDISGSQGEPAHRRTGF